MLTFLRQAQDKLLSVNKLSQRGAVHFLIPILLIAGIVGGVYLVTAGPLKLLPKAASNLISGPIPPKTPKPVPTTSPSRPIPPTSTSKQPDLVVERILNTGSTKVSNNPSKFNVFVRNKGTVEIAGAGSVQVKLQINNPNGSVLGICMAQVQKLLPNQQRVAEFKNCPKFIATGNYKITATIDSTNIVKESNESNNQLTTTVNITK